VQVCRGEACQAVGGRELESHACRTLGCDFHGKSPDGAVSLEPVYCLGNCACSPSVRVGDEVYGYDCRQCRCRSRGPGDLRRSDSKGRID
jgi:formate dehydrogenase subunit gamma